MYNLKRVHTLNNRQKLKKFQKPVNFAQLIYTVKDANFSINRTTKGLISSINPYSSL